MDLYAIQLADMHRLKWKKEAAAADKDATHSQNARSAEQIRNDRNAFNVTIYPMEIRTWSCEYELV